MGKKLPKSKKHKKLKFVDPCYTGSFARQKKAHINQPPTAADYQEVPRNMQELIDSKSKVNTNMFKRKKKKKKIIKDDFIVVKNEIIDNEVPGAKKLKNVPRVVKQKKFENEYQFFNRLQKMADMALAEAKVEEKYNIELVNVDKQGNAQFKPAPKETSVKKKEKRKKIKERLEGKKKMKTDDEEFELKKEHIKFGEVVNAPPVFTAKPRKAPELNKAGTRELALKKLLPSSTEPSKDKKAAPSTKWKTLSVDKRKEMEKERLRAVHMYRMMKNKKVS